MFTGIAHRLSRTGQPLGFDSVQLASRISNFQRPTTTPFNPSVPYSTTSANNLVQSSVSMENIPKKVLREMTQELKDLRTFKKFKYFLLFTIIF